MSNFRRIAKRLHIDFGDFNTWMDQVLNPKSSDPRKKLFDSYDLSLRRVEVALAHLEGFVMENIDRPDFEARLTKRGERMKALERESIKRLELIFRAYRQNRRKGA
jgi:hypothetical protein